MQLSIEHRHQKEFDMVRGLEYPEIESRAVTRFRFRCELSPMHIRHIDLV